MVTIEILEAARKYSTPKVHVSLVVTFERMIGGAGSSSYIAISG